MFLWLAAGVAAAGLPLAASQQMHSSTTRPAVSASRRVAVDLRSSAEDREIGRVLALSDSIVQVTVTGEPNEACLWQLGYGGTVLAQSGMTLDSGGTGQLNLVVPDVKTRAECMLLLESAGRQVKCQMVILPARRLDQSVERINKLRIGVADSSGTIQQAFKAEGADVENIDSQAALESFDGGAMFLAGFRDAQALDEACKSLTSDIEGGMYTVVVNPPVGWYHWGVAPQTVEDKLDLAAEFAKNFGMLVQPEDLGDGPVQTALKADAQWRPLVWLKDISEDETKARVHYPLIVERQMGKGRVIAVMMEQMENPLEDPAGRGILGELTLWILKQQHVYKKEMGGSVK